MYSEETGKTIVRSSLQASCRNKIQKHDAKRSCVTNVCVHMMSHMRAFRVFSVWIYLFTFKVSKSLQRLKAQTKNCTKTINDGFLCDVNCRLHFAVQLLYFLFVFVYIFLSQVSCFINTLYCSAISLKIKMKKLQG